MTPDSVARALETVRYGRALELRAESASTNDDARAAADQGAPDGLVIVADRQTAGRGSHGRAWSSPPGQDLYFSIVARPPLPPSDLPPITLATGLAVSDVVSALAPDATVRVKWPNDVLVDGKKCAGILVESTTVGARIEAAVIGVGLNVNRTVFDDPIARSATSLHLATGRVFDRSAVLAALLSAIEREVDALVAQGAGALVTRVGPRLAWIGERVRVDAVSGRLVGLAQSGALLVEVAPGVVREVRAGTLARADMPPNE